MPKRQEPEPLVQRIRDQLAIPTEVPTADVWLPMPRGSDIKSLVERAWAANPAVGKARANVLTAMADLGLIDPTMLPRVEGIANRLVSKDPAQSQVDRTETRVILRTSWDIDLWGINRLQRQARLAALESAIAEGHRVLLDLATNVVRSLLEYERFQILSATTREELVAIGLNLKELDQRVSLGTADSIEADKLRSEQDEIEAENVRLEVECTIQREVIHTLLGRQGEIPPLPNNVLDSLAVGSVSYTVGSCLRRPEVRSAELAIWRDGASLEAARRAILPSFSLTADIGLVAAVPGDVVSMGMGAWQVLGSLTLPLLDAGSYKNRWVRVRADLKRSESVYAEALAEGLDRLARGQVTLIAFNRRIDALQKASTSATLVATEVSHRISAGTADVLQYLDATRRALTLRRNVIELRYAMASVWVELQGQVAAPPTDNFTQRCDELLIP